MSTPLDTESLAKADIVARPSVTKSGKSGNDELEITAIEEKPKEKTG